MYVRFFQLCAQQFEFHARFAHQRLTCTDRACSVIDMSEDDQRGGVDLTPETRNAFDQSLSGNPRGKHGRVAYDLERHFDRSPEEIRSRFDFYFDQFDVRPEPPGKDAG